MFYTVTLNPAIDYLVTPESLIQGITNRSASEEIRIGGKGINASLVLSALGVSSTALGFLAGFTGEWIARSLKNPLIDPDFIVLPQGMTRINIKIKGESETEINAAGPAVPKAEAGRLLEKIERIKEGDTLILSGNLPKGVSSDFYEQVLEKTGNKKIRLAVDASGPLLRQALSFAPFLIKPNRQELSELFDTPIESRETIAECARLLQEKGAQNVLVSLGGEGSFLLDANGKSHICPALKGKVFDTVGAGDSMVAGFMAGYEQTGDFARAFLLANACGAATAFSPWLADREKIDSCLAAFSQN